MTVWVVVHAVLAGAAMQLAMGQWFRLDLQITVAHRWLAGWAGVVSATLLANAVALAAHGTARDVALVVRVFFVVLTIMAMVIVVGRVVEREPPRWILLPVVAVGVVRLLLWVFTDLVHTGAFDANGMPVYASGHFWTSLPTFPFVLAWMAMTWSLWSDTFERNALLVSMLVTMAVGMLAIYGDSVTREVATGLLVVPLLVGISLVARHRCRHLVVVRDLTRAERDRLSAELSVLNGELRAALSVREDLLDATTHELRTPLTPIRGFVEILRQRWAELGPSGVDETLTVIERNTERLGHLIDEMLAARHLQRGTPVGTPQATRLAPAVRQAILESRAENVDVQCPTGIVIWVNPDHLHQVLVRLLDNANRHGAPPIEVTARLTSGSVEVRVIDHGPGIPREFVPRLFEPFTQASVGSLRTASGVGLGLAVAQRLTQAIGGTLEHVADHPAPGTCFRLLLPLVPEGGHRE